MGQLLHSTTQRRLHLCTITPRPKLPQTYRRPNADQTPLTMCNAVWRCAAMHRACVRQVDQRRWNIALGFMPRPCVPLLPLCAVVAPDHHTHTGKRHHSSCYHAPNAVARALLGSWRRRGWRRDATSLGEDSELCHLGHRIGFEAGSTRAGGDAEALPNVRHEALSHRSTRRHVIRGARGKRHIRMHPLCAARGIDSQVAQ
mmetsp:Transcript_20860/g.53268  ORF Transcript_20860/g.53268 Transcript_20860/m.53268 type:complete len:201 (-) Transcript_20860:1621-2223(-)